MAWVHSLPQEPPHAVGMPPPKKNILSHRVYSRVGKSEIKEHFFNIYIIIRVTLKEIIFGGGAALMACVCVCVCVCVCIFFFLLG